ncbi:MAG: outer membrane lipoprotein carrier protein LolA [Treponematales bacterium]
MKQCFLAFALLWGGAHVFSQEIITAERYLTMVSERYVEIKDYEAHLSLLSGNTSMTGTVSFLAPNFLRIDFSDPREQVVLFNGETLTVYLPEQRAILSQAITASGQSGAAGAGLATSQGLVLLRRNYVPAFITSPEPQPLDDVSKERVVKLRLTRRLVAEGFREIILSVLPDSLLIRRIEGTTIANVRVVFNFTNVKTNLGIPQQRFIYDSPASANLYNNFLFRDTD